MRNVKVLLCFLSLVGVAFATDYTTLARELDRAETFEAAANALRRSGLMDGPPSSMQDAARNFIDGGVFDQSSVDSLQRASEVPGMLSGKMDPVTINPADVTAMKDSPLFRDAGTKQSSNWLLDAFNNLGESIRRFFEGRPNESSSRPTTGSGVDLSFLAPLFTILAYVLVAAIVVGALYLIFSNIFGHTKAKKKKRNVSNLIRAEEAHLTLDEWLEKGNGLMTQGDYREAIRCFYVASLIRLDESGKLALISYETNWEHLQRYESSGQSANLRSPTAAFDRIWYGNDLADENASAQFRTWYQDIHQQVGGTTK